MSEDKDTAQEAQSDSEAVETQAVETVESTPAPIILKVHGREFDVSTEIGRAQHQAWSEAFSTMVGKNSAELGRLRKFEAERKPSADEAELLSKAKAKASEGDVEGAIEMVFSQAKEAELKAAKKLELDRKNSELWDEYFSERPDLAKKIGRTRVKTIAETLDIYNEEKDAFKTLDEFFLPLVPSEKPTDKKPPVTLSGGSPKTTLATAKTEAKTLPNLSDLLDAKSLNRK